MHRHSISHQNKLISSLKSDLEYICVCVNIYTQIYSRVDFNDEINLFCVIYASPVYAVGKTIQLHKVV